MNALINLAIREGHETICEAIALCCLGLTIVSLVGIAVAVGSVT